MFGQDKYERFLKTHPGSGRPFNRPHWNRRQFMQILGTGLTASMIPQQLVASNNLEVVSKAAVTTKGTAKNVVYIMLSGGMTHVDTFDLKVGSYTPAAFNPTPLNGVNFPLGLMPKLGAQFNRFAIVRSMRAWAAVHSLARRWQQIGRNPAAVLGDVAPNMGSVAAIELEPERQPGQVLPAFLSLSNRAEDQGYFPAMTAPFRVNAGQTSLPNTTSPFGEERFTEAFAELNALDAPIRIGAPYGPAMGDVDAFYSSARGLMYNQTISDTFTIAQSDRARYGNTGFGNACLLAKQILEAEQGTRYLQLNLGGWDMHSNIYATLPARCQQLDDGLSELMTDLAATGKLDETLIVMMGEFGRTTGNLNGRGGRDHYLQQFCFFAGAGVRGGQVIGSTDSLGRQTVESGWGRGREIRTEDVEATIYSALGIDWTTIRYDDPLKRGFEYVPFARDDIYGPINELWS